MKYCVLTSGSKGNCTYIEINNKKYLIDAGTNFLYISNKLKEIDIDIKDIEGIFITHCHDDHTSALKRIIKVVNPIIYITEKTKKELVEEWENTDEGDNLFYFFYYNLYPIVRWSNGLDGNYYDRDKMMVKEEPNTLFLADISFKKEKLQLPKTLRTFIFVNILTS